MPELQLPPTLTSLFDGLPKHMEVEAGTVTEVLDRLEESWPGVRDRLCHPGPDLREHIHVYVDKERAALDTRLEPGSHVIFVAAISGG